jgi:signal transduction histidine kinase/CheY-like chemotaxis protein
MELETLNQELARTRADLERSNAGRESLFEISPVPHFTLRPDGQIERLNAAAATLLQIDPSQGPGQRLATHLDTLTARTFHDHLETVFGGKRASAAVKLRPRGEQGLRHLLIVSQPLDSGGSGGRHCLSACVDLTDQVRSDEAKKQLERQLVNTQRLESLGQLAGGIAHDFNNLLTGVLGHAELLDMSETLDEGERQCVAMIRKAATSAAKLCQQMLTSAGRSAGTLEAVNLNDTVRDAAALLSVSISKDIKIDLRLTEELPPIEGDFAQLNQAVLNLLINAEEAIGHEAGTIEIGTRLTALAAGYRDASYFGPDVPPGDYVEIWISDTGIGMSPVTLSHIFDPFFTTKFTGRGLGLSTVFGTVRWHNGTIAVRTAPGVGAAFRIFLPVQRRPLTSAGSIQPRITQTRSLVGKTILLIEDEEPVRVVVASLLQRAGAQVFSAQDGYAGLDLFRAHRAEITHILLDLIMPGMTGEETLSALKELGEPLPPVIILSGYAGPEMQTRLNAYGVAGQLQKPCSIVQLATEICNAG